MSRFALALTLVLALCLAAAAGASATTRFAKPGAPPKVNDCTDRADPCPLPSALDQAQTGDTISLANGTYPDNIVALPPWPLHWVVTDPGTRPLLTSGGNAPTVALAAAQSGTTFDGIEIAKTVGVPETTGVPALQVAAGVTATVRSAVIRGPVCVEAPDAAALTIARSSLSSPAGSTCARIGGLIEDSRVDGELQLTGANAVARRVDASGATAIRGQGLVVDSLARAVGSQGAAIAADAPQGGTLRVINATAIAHEAPALLARAVRSATGPVGPNVLSVSNSIARGGPADVQGTASVACAIGEYCDLGRIALDHSNFAVRDPAPGAPGAAVIAADPGNQSADPRFADAGAGDYHLRAGSPAIDAGAPQAAAAPADLDGRPRPQGLALDLGAYETPAPGAGAAGSGAAGRPTDRTAPVLGRLRLSHSRFRARTKLTTTISEAGRLRLSVERRASGRRDHGRCVARAAKKAAPCTRWAARGVALTRRVAGAGRVTLSFSGRVGGRRLSPGRYRFVLEATDAAGNRAVRRATFTVVGAS